MVQRHTIDAIRERADLVEVVSQVVTLKRKGTSHLGLCPFHQEKSPSFKVVPHKGIFHCFGCGEGGDVFRFVMKTRGISFMDAVKELGQTYGIAVEERPLSPDEQRRQQKVAGLHDVVEIAAQYFHSVLQTRPEGRAAREYLTARGVTPASIATFRLGFAPDSWDALLDHLHRQGVPPDLAVAAGVDQALVLVLAGQIDEPRAELGLAAGGGERPRARSIKSRARSSRCRKRATPSSARIGSWWSKVTST